MKAGIVGLGKMGLLHTGILNTLKDVQVVSIAEKENFVAKYIKNALPTVHVYDDYEKMLDKENLDVLYITTPAPSHYPMIMSCIKKGINFFVEKPLSTNLVDAKKICNELKKSNIINGVGFNVRYVDTFSKAKSLIDSNVLGKINKVKSSQYVSNIFSKPSGWRFKKKSSGGGVLLEFGCHLVDLLSWYFGPVQNLTATTKSVYSSVDDFAHIDMNFQNGINAEFDTSWSIKGYRISETSIEITGSNGQMILNQDFIDVKLKEIVPGFSKLDSKIYKQSLNGSVSFDVGGPDYTIQDEKMIECIKTKHLPLVNAFEASKTQSIIQAAYDSAESKNEEKVEYIE